MTVRPPNPDALVRWIGGADQQLRNLQSAPPVSWNNIRYGDQQDITTDGGGFATVPFAAPFDHQCLVVIIGDTGGNGAWISWAQWHRPDAFGVWVANSTAGGYVGNCHVTYVAFGY